MLDAEQRGELRPGGTVVEGTAGNTGIGLAHVCNARGYRCVIVMPDNQSPEKYRLLETLGAEVHKVPAVPYSNPNQYQKVAQRLARHASQRHLGQPVRQHRQPRTRTARTTGPEIWAQTDGRIDAFVAASGTGGTLAGVVATTSRPAARAIRCVLADPPGSSLYEFVRTGVLKATGSGSITEGIGIGRITANLAAAPHRRRAAHRGRARRCATSTGCCTRRACSSAAPAASTSPRRCAWRASSVPGTRIVTVLCDGGAKYQSRLFNREWLAQKGLAGPAAMRGATAPLSLKAALVA